MRFTLFKINNMFITTIPKIFQTKKKIVSMYPLNASKGGPITNINNHVYKPRHYPPFTKE